MYVASIIDIPKNAITEINNIIKHFIWKTSKIAQSTLIQSIEHGDLNLCHFETKSKALKLSWVKRLINRIHANGKLLQKSFYNCHNLNTFFFANHKLVCSHKIPPFYKDMHMLLMKYFKLDPVNLIDILT